jgi:hypothetical protein
VLATPLIVVTALTLPSWTTNTVAVPALASVPMKASVFWSGDQDGKSMRQAGHAVFS